MWTQLNLMGPNVLWLTEALSQVLPLEPGMRVLDLGCGSAISSIFLARQFGVEVWAADLWIEPSSNRTRINEAGVGDRVFPIETEAHALPFAHRFFDALVSIDSYHYFGTDVRYLSYAAQFVRPGGHIGIVVPGNAVDPDDLGARARATAPFGADYFTFRSAEWWARHWSRTTGVEVTHADMLAKGSGSGTPAPTRRGTASRSPIPSTGRSCSPPTERISASPASPLAVPMRTPWSSVPVAT